MTGNLRDILGEPPLKENSVGAFLLFLDELIQDFANPVVEWQNLTVDHYLEACHACDDACNELNHGRPQYIERNATRLSWQQLAELIEGGRGYE